MVQVAQNPQRTEDGGGALQLLNPGKVVGVCRQQWPSNVQVLGSLIKHNASMGAVRHRSRRLPTYHGLFLQLFHLCKLYPSEEKACDPSLWMNF